MIAIETRTTQIDDLRHHTPEQIAELGKLLDEGVVGRPDLRRPDFYEVDGVENVYYVLRYPSGDKVSLIAAWKKGSPVESDGTKSFLADR